MIDNLRGVLVGPRSDGEVQIRLVELFDQSLLVHWSARIPNEEPATDRTGDGDTRMHAYHGYINALQVTDDLGTEYIPAGGRGGGGNGVWRGERWFLTPVPPGAEALTVTLRDSEVTLWLAALAQPPA